MNDDTAKARRHERVLVSLLGATTGLGHGFYHFGISAFLKPLAEALQLPRGTIAGGIAAGRALSGIATLVAGHLSDRCDARHLLSAGALLLAAGLLAASLAQTAWQLLLAWSVVAAVGVAFGFTLVLDRLVLTLVPPARHGAALGWRFSGISVGTAMAAMLAGLLLASFGWRATCAVWAVVMLLCAGLVQWLTLPPASPLSNRAAPPPSAGGWRQVLGHRAFWLLALVSVLVAGVQSAVIVHMVPLLTDVGVAPASAAAFLGTLALLGVPGRLLAGTWSDSLRHDQLRWLLAAAIGTQAAALAVFVGAPGLPAALAMGALYGLASGVPLPLMLLLQSRSLGRGHFGTAQGCIAALQIPFVVVLPVAAGVLHDRSGHYQGAFAACIVMLLVALIASTRLAAGSALTLKPAS